MTTIMILELRQRVRGIGWYILLAAWTVVIGAVTIITWLSAQSIESLEANVDTYWLFSLIVYFVLLMALLVTPAITGGSINGDRQDGVLATTQVTLVTTFQIIAGKFLASFIISLVFLLTAAPFLVLAAVWGGVGWGSALVALAVVLFEMAVVCALGVGLSGILQRPLFSVVATYLLVALLSIGTVIAFGLGTAISTTTKETPVKSLVMEGDEGWETAAPLAPLTDDQKRNPDGSVIPDDEIFDPGAEGYRCAETTEMRSYARWDYNWWMLSLNPFVVLSDAVPTSFDVNNQPADLFGLIKLGVRSAQLPPEMDASVDYCADYGYYSGQQMVESAKDIQQRTAPSWYIGAIVHLLLGAGALLGAYRRTRVPAQHLPSGQRIA